MKRMAFGSLAILFAIAVLLLFFGPAAPDREAISTGFSTAHWAGTDELGRDRAQRMGAAFVLGLAGAAAAALLATCVTIVVAMAAVFSKGPARAVVLYVSDLCLALPWLFLLMLVRAVLPLSLPAAASAVVSYALLAALGWPIYVRSVTARLAAVQQMDWFLHARAGGSSFPRVLRMHVLPHLWPISMTQFLLCVPLFLIAEANLGSLGLGVSEPLVSWGSLLGEVTTSTQLATTRWVYLPLAMLVASVLCMEIVGAEE
ncbi:MAG: ABC transporter permease subunit [Janthinobacterium lividum]